MLWKMFPQPEQVIDVKIGLLTEKKQRISFSHMDFKPPNYVETAAKDHEVDDISRSKR